MYSSLKRKCYYVLCIINENELPVLYHYNSNPQRSDVQCFLLLLVDHIFPFLAGLRNTTDIQLC